MLRAPFSVLLLLCGLLLASCDSARVFEENVDLPDYAWPEKQQPVFRFQITDIEQPYDLFINIRNATAYPYHNLYVKHYLYGGDSTLINSALHNLHISDQKTGEPFGSGMGDIFDHRVRFLRNVKFTRPGTYSVKLQQYMRLDTVPGIMAVGLRVAKAEAPAR